MEVVNNTIAIKQKSLEDWEKELENKQDEIEGLQENSNNEQLK